MTTKQMDTSELKKYFNYDKDKEMAMQKIIADYKKHFSNDQVKPYVEELQTLLSDTCYSFDEKIRLYEIIISGFRRFATNAPQKEPIRCFYPYLMNITNLLYSYYALYSNSEVVIKRCTEIISNLIFDFCVLHFTQEKTLTKEILISKIIPVISHFLSNCERHIFNVVLRLMQWFFNNKMYTDSSKVRALFFFIQSLLCKTFLENIKYKFAINIKELIVYMQLLLLCRISKQLVHILKNKQQELANDNESDIAIMAIIVDDKDILKLIDLIHATPTHQHLHLVIEDLDGVFPIENIEKDKEDLELVGRIQDIKSIEAYTFIRSLDIDICVAIQSLLDFQIHFQEDFDFFGNYIRVGSYYNVPSTITSFELENYLSIKNVNSFNSNFYPNSRHNCFNSKKIVHLGDPFVLADQVLCKEKSLSSIRHRWDGKGEKIQALNSPDNPDNKDTLKLIIKKSNFEGVPEIFARHINDLNLSLTQDLGKALVVFHGDNNESFVERNVFNFFNDKNTIHFSTSRPKQSTRNRNPIFSHCCLKNSTNKTDGKKENTNQQNMPGSSLILNKKPSLSDNENIFSPPLIQKDKCNVPSQVLIQKESCNVPSQVLIQKEKCKEPFISNSSHLENTPSSSHIQNKKSSLPSNLSSSLGRNLQCVTSSQNNSRPTTPHFVRINHNTVELKGESHNTVSESNRVPCSSNHESCRKIRPKSKAELFHDYHVPKPVDHEYEDLQNTLFSDNDLIENSLFPENDLIEEIEEVIVMDDTQSDISRASFNGLVNYIAPLEITASIESIISGESVSANDIEVNNVECIGQNVVIESSADLMWSGQNESSVLHHDNNEQQTNVGETNYSPETLQGDAVVQNMEVETCDSNSLAENNNSLLFKVALSASEIGEVGGDQWSSCLDSMDVADHNNDPYNSDSSNRASPSHEPIQDESITSQTQESENNYAINTKNRNLVVPSKPLTDDSKQAHLPKTPLPKDAVVDEKKKMSKTISKFNRKRKCEGQNLFNIINKICSKKNKSGDYQEKIRSIKKEPVNKKLSKKMMPAKIAYLEKRKSIYKTETIFSKVNVNFVSPSAQKTTINDGSNDSSKNVDHLNKLSTDKGKKNVLNPSSLGQENVKKNFHLGQLTKEIKLGPKQQVKKGSFNKINLIRNSGTTNSGKSTKTTKSNKSLDFNSNNKSCDKSGFSSSGHSISKTNKVSRHFNTSATNCQSLEKLKSNNQCSENLKRSTKNSAMQSPEKRGGSILVSCEKTGELSNYISSNTENSGNLSTELSKSSTKTISKTKEDAHVSVELPEMLAEKRIELKCSYKTPGSIKFIEKYDLSNELTSNLTIGKEVSKNPCKITNSNKEYPKKSRKVINTRGNNTNSCKEHKKTKILNAIKSNPALNNLENKLDSGKNTESLMEEENNTSTMLANNKLGLDSICDIVPAEDDNRNDQTLENSTEDLPLLRRLRTNKVSNIKQKIEIDDTSQNHKKSKNKKNELDINPSENNNAQLLKVTAEIHSEPKRSLDSNAKDHFLDKGCIPADTGGLKISRNNLNGLAEYSNCSDKQSFSSKIINEDIPDSTRNWAKVPEEVKLSKHRRKKKKKKKIKKSKDRSRSNSIDEIVAAVREEIQKEREESIMLSKRKLKVSLENDNEIKKPLKNSRILNKEKIPSVNKIDDNDMNEMSIKISDLNECIQKEVRRNNKLNVSIELDSLLGGQHADSLNNILVSKKCDQHSSEKLEGDVEKVDDQMNKTKSRELEQSKSVSQNLKSSQTTNETEELISTHESDSFIKSPQAKFQNSNHKRLSLTIKCNKSVPSDSRNRYTLVTKETDLHGENTAVSVTTTVEDTLQRSSYSRRKNSSDSDPFNTLLTFESCEKMSDYEEEKEEGRSRCFRRSTSNLSTPRNSLDDNCEPESVETIRSFLSSFTSDTYLTDLSTEVPACNVSTNIKTPAKVLKTKGTMKEFSTNLLDVKRKNESTPQIDPTLKTPYPKSHDTIKHLAKSIPDKRRDLPKKKSNLDNVSTKSLFIQPSTIPCGAVRGPEQSLTMQPPAAVPNVFSNLEVSKAEPNLVSRNLALNLAEIKESDLVQVGSFFYCGDSSKLPHNDEYIRSELLETETDDQELFEESSSSEVSCNENLNQIIASLSDENNSSNSELSSRKRKQREKTEKQNQRTVKNENLANLRTDCPTPSKKANLNDYLTNSRSGWTPPCKDPSDISSKVNIAINLEMDVVQNTVDVTSVSSKNSMHGSSSMHTSSDIKSEAKFNNSHSSPHLCFQVGDIQMPDLCEPTQKVPWILQNYDQSSGSWKQSESNPTWNSKRTNQDNMGKYPSATNVCSSNLPMPQEHQDVFDNCSQTYHNNSMQINVCSSGPPMVQEHPDVFEHPSQTCLNESEQSYPNSRINLMEQKRLSKIQLPQTNVMFTSVQNSRISQGEIPAQKHVSNLAESINPNHPSKTTMLSPQMKANDLLQITQVNRSTAFAENTNKNSNKIQIMNSSPHMCGTQTLNGLRQSSSVQYSPSGQDEHQYHRMQPIIVQNQTQNVLFIQRSEPQLTGTNSMYVNRVVTMSSHKQSQESVKETPLTNGQTDPSCIDSLITDNSFSTALTHAEPSVTLVPFNNSNETTQQIQTAMSQKTIQTPQNIILPQDFNGLIIQQDTSTMLSQSTFYQGFYYEPFGGVIAKKRPVDTPNVTEIPIAPTAPRMMGIAEVLANPACHPELQFTLKTISSSGTKR